MNTYESFKADILKMTEIDLNAYKEKQMKRRIDSLIAKHGVDGYDNFVRLLRSNHDVFEEFVNYLTINVSEFYRNPNQWDILENDILPQLLKQSGNNLKIWSAACSTGDEPYSLIMLLSKFMPLEKTHVLATDIDNQVIEKAKAGLYSEKSLAGLPSAFRERFFSKVGEKNYAISPEVKKRVTFQQHNLLKDSYPTGLDMIVCRNVMIYFTEEAKEEIYQKFHQALRPGGILFVGSTEQIINSSRIGFQSKYSFFYEKV